MSKTKRTRCGECGGTVGPFTTYFNASTAETHYICDRCSAEGAASELTDLAEIDQYIARLEVNLFEMEPMLKQSTRQDDDLPESFRQFVQTPMTVYKSMQAHLAALKTRRIELVRTTRNPEKLQYELDKLIAEENYEGAALLKKELDTLRATPPKKSDLKEKKSKVFDQNTDATVGRCISCKTNYPKPPGLFQDFDDPKIHDMCLSCIGIQMVSLVRSVKSADYMIKEMEGFAKITDAMATLGKMIEMDEDERDKFKSIEDLPKAKSSTQRFNEKFIKNLKEHRDFLGVIKENPENIEKFVKMHEMFHQLQKEDKELFQLLGETLMEVMKDKDKKPKRGSSETGKEERKKKP